MKEVEGGIDLVESDEFCGRGWEGKWEGRWERKSGKRSGKG